MIIEPEDERIYADEMMMSALMIPIIIRNGSGTLGPGVQCDVTVFTTDGTANSEFLQNYSATPVLTIILYPCLTGSMDYVPVMTVLTFNSTTTRQYISVTIMDDFELEEEETFFIDVRSSDARCRPGRGAVVTIDESGEENCILCLFHNGITVFPRLNAALE